MPPLKVAESKCTDSKLVAKLLSTLTSAGGNESVICKAISSIERAVIESKETSEELLQKGLVLLLGAQSLQPTGSKQLALCALRCLTAVSMHELSDQLVGAGLVSILKALLIPFLQ